MKRLLRSPLGASGFFFLFFYMNGNYKSNPNSGKLVLEEGRKRYREWLALFLQMRSTLYPLERAIVLLRKAR